MIILNDGDNYPCLSSLSGTKCTYYKGSIQNSTTDFVLTWDRVDIVLPGT